LKTLIYQDIWSKRISRVKLAEVEGEVEFLIDCDEDSILIQKHLPPDPHLARVISKDSVYFQEPLLPVVVQDREGIVLMQAFVDFKALELSFQEGYSHFFSRSKNRIWKKGEESGHLQKILLIEYSPLYKYLVYKVEQNKAACHTGYYSCFYRKLKGNQVELVYPSKIFEPEKVYVQ
jgi:phosphoribosyl-AMP cyclohydrolase